MNTFFNNLVEAGASVKSVPNGIYVELYHHFWIFTEDQIGLYGDGNGTYSSTSLKEKKPVVLVEKESIVWGKYIDVQYTIPMDGSKYKVFC